MKNNEVSQIKASLLCDEVFGEDKRILIFVGDGRKLFKYVVVIKGNRIYTKTKN
jgi:hypothetical protein